MPTYEYKCRSCAYGFETFQSMSDDALTNCPKCKNSQLRRLIRGGSGIIFKGSGFYVNDSRSSSSSSTESKPEGKSSNDANSTSSASSSGKASA